MSSSEDDPETTPARAWVELQDDTLVATPLVCVHIREVAAQLEQDVPQLCSRLSLPGPLEIINGVGHDGPAWLATQLQSGNPHADAAHMLVFQRVLEQLIYWAESALVAVTSPEPTQVDHGVKTSSEPRKDMAVVRFVEICSILSQWQARVFQSHANRPTPPHLEQFLNESCREYMRDCLVDIASEYASRLSVWMDAPEGAWARALQGLSNEVSTQSPGQPVTVSNVVVGFSHAMDWLLAHLRLPHAVMSPSKPQTDILTCQPFNLTTMYAAVTYLCFPTNLCETGELNRLPTVSPALAVIPVSPALYTRLDLTTMPEGKAKSLPESNWQIRIATKTATLELELGADQPTNLDPPFMKCLDSLGSALFFQSSYASWTVLSATHFELRTTTPQSSPTPILATFFGSLGHILLRSLVRIPVLLPGQSSFTFLRLPPRIKSSPSANETELLMNASSRLFMDSLSLLTSITPTLSSSSTSSASDNKRNECDIQEFDRALNFCREFLELYADAEGKVFAEVLLVSGIVLLRIASLIRHSVLSNPQHLSHLETGIAHSLFAYAALGQTAKFSSATLRRLRSSLRIASQYLYAPPATSYYPLLPPASLIQQGGDTDDEESVESTKITRFNAWPLEVGVSLKLNTVRSNYGDPANHFALIDSLIIALAHSSRVGKFRATLSADMLSRIVADHEIVQSFRLLPGVAEGLAEDSWEHAVLTRLAQEIRELAAMYSDDALTHSSRYVTTQVAELIDHVLHGSTTSATSVLEREIRRALCLLYKAVLSPTSTEPAFLPEQPETKTPANLSDSHLGSASKVKADEDEVNITLEDLFTNLTRGKDQSLARLTFDSDVNSVQYSTRNARRYDVLAALEQMQNVLGLDEVTVAFPLLAQYADLIDLFGVPPQLVEALPPQCPLPLRLHHLKQLRVTLQRCGLSPNRVVVFGSLARSCPNSYKHVNDMDLIIELTSEKDNMWYSTFLESLRDTMGSGLHLTQYEAVNLLLHYFSLVNTAMTSTPISKLHQLRGTFHPHEQAVKAQWNWRDLARHALQEPIRLQSQWSSTGTCHPYRFITSWDRPSDCVFVKSGATEFVRKHFQPSRADKVPAATWLIPLVGMRQGRSVAELVEAKSVSEEERLGYAYQSDLLPTAALILFSCICGMTKNVEIQQSDRWYDTLEGLVRKINFELSQGITIDTLVSFCVKPEPARMWVKVLANLIEPDSNLSYAFRCARQLLAQPLNTGPLDYGVMNSITRSIFDCVFGQKETVHKH